MGCSELKEWPGNVFKILHVVFCGLATIFLLIAMFAIEVFAELKTISGARNVWTFDPDLVKFEPSAITWIIFVIFPFICGVALLIWFYTGEPTKHKMALFIYYIVAVVFVGIALAASIIHIIFLFDFNYMSKSTTEKSGFKNSSIFATGFFWVTILAFICTIGAFVTYIYSGIFNWRNGDP